MPSIFPHHFTHLPSSFQLFFFIASLVFLHHASNLFRQLINVSSIIRSPLTRPLIRALLVSPSNHVHQPMKTHNYMRETGYFLARGLTFVQTFGKFKNFALSSQTNPGESVYFTIVLCSFTPFLL